MIKLGLIGCGNISKGHAAKFSSLSDRMLPAVAVDVDPTRAEVAANELGGIPSCTDYRRILQDVDAVLLALPHHLHYEIGIECLRAGKHVLMEKPLANTEQECLDLIRLADEQKKILMVAYCMRYNPLVHRLKELLERQMKHFLDCIETGTNPETHGMSALQSLRVIWRMYEAEEKGIIADLRGLGLPQDSRPRGPVSS